MKVKIEEKNLRFKISVEELETLLDGHCLNVKLPLLDKTLIATINPEGNGEAMESKLVSDQSEVYLNLLVPPAHIQKLSDMGASRDGLKQEVSGISINLQVDTREVCKA